MPDIARERVFLDLSGQPQNVVWETRRQRRGVGHWNLLAGHCEILQFAILKKKPSVDDASGAVSCD